jgi:hypothetical protein
MGTTTGMPPAWSTELSYLMDRLADKSLNSTPHFSTLGDTNIKGILTTPPR